MYLRTRALFLLLVIAWQTVSVLGAWSVAQRSVEFEHLAVHSQDVNHHHHADQSLHLDGDEISAQHSHSNSMTNPAAILPLAQPKLARVLTASPSEISPFVWLSPTLEGLIRPPMHLAL